MANTVFQEGIESILDGTIVLATDTMKAALCSASFAANFDDQFTDNGDADDVESTRLSGTTDQTLSSKATGKDNTGDFAYFDAADVTYTAVTTAQTAAWVVVYKDTGTPTTSRLVAALDITDTPTNGGDITITWAAPSSGGIVKFQST